MTLKNTLLANKNGPMNFCVGIDPDTATLAKWGLEDSADGALQFARAIIEAAANEVHMVKPQIAYFERFGSKGYAVLEQLIAECRERDLHVLADVKRNDIGSTIDAYSQAWLGPNAPMRVDAITVSPYLGVEALDPLLKRAADDGAYVFVVARSSNPEGTALQMHGEMPLWHRVLDDIDAWCSRNNSQNVGAVVGATVPAELAFALKRLPESLFLAPGIGAQGASVEDVKALGVSLAHVIATSSRGIAAHGPNVEDLSAAIRAAQ